MDELINKTELMNDLKKDMAESDNWLIIAMYMAFIVRLTSYPVVKIVHGKWIDCTCSHCGYDVLPWNRTYYCPNCGARMDGER